ncbi:MAG: hypothetical protein ACLTSX_11715 [Collinsella sp.]
MAVLTEDDVRAIADYATIALDETELAAMTSYLNDACGHAPSPYWIMRPRMSSRRFTRTAALRM